MGVGVGTKTSMRKTKQYKVKKKKKLSKGQLRGRQMGKWGKLRSKERKKDRKRYAHKSFNIKTYTK